MEAPPGSEITRGEDAGLWPAVRSTVASSQRTGSALPLEIWVAPDWRALRRRATQTAKVWYSIPDKPNSRLQKYRLTAK